MDEGKRYRENTKRRNIGGDMGLYNKAGKHKEENEVKTLYVIRIIEPRETKRDKKRLRAGQRAVKYEERIGYVMGKNILKKCLREKKGEMIKTKKENVYWKWLKSGDDTFQIKTQ